MALRIKIVLLFLGCACIHLATPGVSLAQENLPTVTAAAKAPHADADATETNPPLPPPDPPVQPALASAQLSSDQQTVAKYLSSKPAQLTGLGSDLLQVVGQVVVERASKAALKQAGLLLRRVLRCKDNTSGAGAPLLQFSKVCMVLDEVEIKDIVALPKGLLDASLVDLATIVSGYLQDSTVIGKGLNPRIIKNIFTATKETLEGVSTFDDVPAVLKQALACTVNEEIKNKIAEKYSTDCPASDTVNLNNVLWVFARCIHGKVTNAGNTVPMLEVVTHCKSRQQTLLDSCFTGQNKVKNKQRMTWLLSDLYQLFGQDKKKAPLGAVKLIFRAAREALGGTKEEKKAAKRVLTGLEKVVWALVTDKTGDRWITVTQGAIEALSGLVALRNGGGDEDRAKEESVRLTGSQKFLRVLASLGQYAVTYKTSSKDRAAAQAARKEIISDLVDSLTDRSEREEGWVFSLGGSLGLGYAFRPTIGTNDGEAEHVFPLFLPIGVGVQQYRTCGSIPYGLHVQVSIFDLGQYVTWDDDDDKVKVQEPDVEDALSISLLVGLWSLDRELPVFLAANFGVTPFVRTEKGDPAIFVGGMLGVYVPFIDFN